jgi:hypothetical protein
VLTLAINNVANKEEATLEFDKQQPIKHPKPINIGILEINALQQKHVKHPPNYGVTLPSPKPGAHPWLPQIFIASARTHGLPHLP